MIPEGIFRAYDIRGVYGKDLTEEIVQRIGRAFAAYMDGEGKTVLLGRDIRLSSKPLGDAFSKGMLEGGLNVEDVGTVTTPLLNWASVHYKKDGGVMVTASHNPAEWNGLKIWAGNSFISMGMGMEALRDLAVKGKFPRSSSGHSSKYANAIKNYEGYVSKKVKIEKDQRIIADPGNGSCCLLTPSLFQKTGITVDAINTKPDGTFPAHSPEPNEETMSEAKRLVLKKKSDFGVGFDGDGDRAVFVDDTGRMVSSTDIFLMLTEHYLERRRGAAVVYEVSCSLAVEETIKAYGGKPVLSRVGHTYIADKMLKENAVFGGETSGHFYFMDVYGFDDAMFTCLKVAEVLSKRGQKFSEIVDSLPKYPRIPGKSYECAEEKKFLVVEKLAKDFADMGYSTVTIDGVKVIEDEGWFLIRPSNTQPLVRLTVEAKTEENLQKLASLADEKITKIIKTA